MAADSDLRQESGLKIIAGVDLGTTNLKVTICDNKGSILWHDAKPSPISYTNYDADIIEPLQALLRPLLKTSSNLSGIGIATVAPAIACVHYLQSKAHLISSHLTPTQRETSRFNYLASDIATRTIERRARTLDRLTQFRFAQCDGATAVIPLTTLLGLIAAGREIHDAVSWYELGFELSSDLGPHRLHIGRTVSIVEGESNILASHLPGLIGPQADLKMIVTTDTVASGMSAQVIGTDNFMLYLGSYVGVVQFHYEPLRLGNIRQLVSPPYTWTMSMPLFGQTLDNLLGLLSLSDDSAVRYRYLNAVIEQTDELTDGQIQVRGGGTAIGGESSPTISIDGIGPRSTGEEIVSAMLTFVAKNAKSSIVHSKRCYVGGGGAANSVLVHHIAAIAQVKLLRAAQSWTAIGLAKASISNNNTGAPI